MGCVSFRMVVVFQRRCIVQSRDGELLHPGGPGGASGGALVDGLAQVFLGLWKVAKGL